MNHDSQFFFRHSGYLVVRKAFDANVCETLTRKALEDPYPENFTYLDSQSRRTRINGVTESFGLPKIFSQQFTSAVTDLLGPNWVVVLNRHNHITMDYGCGLDSRRLHRDSLHWSRQFLTVVIALRMPESCSSYPRFIPGSHLWPIGAPPNGGGYWLDQDTLRHHDEQAVSLRLGAGDALFIDPFTFHGAGIGSPSSPRIVMTLALRATDELADGPAVNELVSYGKHSYAGQVEWGHKNA
jgi:hypothetical protein